MAAALQAKPFVAGAKQRVAQRKPVVVCAAQRDAPSPAASLKLMGAALAAAALLHGAPADAGVILVQPETKKVFVDDGSPKSAAAPKAKAAPKPKAPEASFQEGADFKGFVLPLSLAAIAGGAAVISKIDPGFLEMMEEAGAKDSRAYAGYETALKDTPFFGGSGTIKVTTPKAGTAKKSVAKPAAGSKKGGTISKFFGKN